MPVFMDVSMADSFDPWRALGEIPGSRSRSVRYLPTADRTIFSKIRLGVLFVMAWWSGGAQQSFRRLKAVLSELDPDGRLELVIVDTDGATDLHASPEFHGQLHGWGEVAWIRKGQVLRTSGIGPHPECIEAYTRELLMGSSEPSATIHPN